jgi:general secretion pathway protein B
MSLILDALKKLEREKAASRKGPADIVPAIINLRNSRPKSANWKLPVVIISVIAATATVTTAVVIALAPRGIRPVPSVSVNGENARPVPTSLASTGQADSKIIPEPGTGRLSVEAVKAPSAKLSPPSAAEDRQPRIESHESKPAIEKTDDSVRSAGGSFTDLKVSGIAWQEDRADRRAVVNGALLGEGAAVEGARIVRIFQDRVRFSRSGETFEITIASSPQAK